MKKIWSRLEHELSTKAKAILESMNPPAEEADIEVLEEHIGQELPVDYRDFLLTHNGQSQESNPGFFDMFSLMPLDLVEESWNELDTLREDIGEESACPGDWMPFAEDGTGDLICVELETGAVSKFISDDENEHLADSFEGWLAEMFTVMKNDEFVFDPSSGLGIESRSPDTEENDEERSVSDDEDEDEAGEGSNLSYKFTAKSIDVFEDGEKMSSVQRGDILRVRVSSYAGEPLISLTLPDGSDPEEIELPANLPNAADLNKFFAKLKDWNGDAFENALASTKGDGDTVVWG